MSFLFFCMFCFVTVLIRSCFSEMSLETCPVNRRKYFCICQTILCLNILHLSNIDTNNCMHTSLQAQARASSHAKRPSSELDNFISISTAPTHCTTQHHQQHPNNMLPKCTSSPSPSTNPSNKPQDRPLHPPPPRNPTQRPRPRLPPHPPAPNPPPQPRLHF
jgi:hypothetical protein